MKPLNYLYRAIILLFSFVSFALFVPSVFVPSVFFSPVVGQLISTAQAADSDVNAVATFHSIGLTWEPNSASGSREATVRFRPKGGNEWLPGHPLWYAGDGEYRGSLVELVPGTTYEIELHNGNEGETLRATTWSEEFPIAETVFVDEQDSPLEITRSGRADGYILYTPREGSSGIIDVEGSEEYTIRVDARYVIIRGFILKNSEVNGIELDEDARDVVIEQNDISGWGRTDSRDGWGVNQDSAIFSSHSEAERIIIQRNRIHHPRSDSNNWSEESYSTYGGRKHHPEGPQAIYFANSRGNHVIRYNEIYSDEDHKYNDCIGGGANSRRGFPGNNSDIYGNIVQDCWDDALEIEGYNQNVRIWGNYTNRTYMHIATRPTQEGPLYIWRNVADASRKEHAPWDWDDDKRGHFIKSGNLNDRGGGRVYVYHNTMLQSDGDESLNLSRKVGSSKGLSGAMRNYVTRNNILYVLRSGDSIHQEKSYDNNDFDYDLFNGELDRLSGHEQNGIRGYPTYVSGRLDALTGYGDFSLAPLSAGYDAALIIPNFSTSYAGNGPDMGAHEAGSPLMQFGVNAYLTDRPENPEPERPEPVEPEPVEPAPVEPAPVEPSPIEPGPVKPGPVKPSPVGPGPVESNPVTPGSTLVPDPSKRVFIALFK